MKIAESLVRPEAGQQDVKLTRAHSWAPPYWRGSGTGARGIQLFFFSSRRRHTRFDCDWSSDVCSSDLVTLMVSYSVLLQGYGVWKLRHALAWRRVAPFIIGGAIGVPAGAMLLAHINPAHPRTAGGGVLLLYSIYHPTPPGVEAVRGGGPSATIIGVVPRA